MNGKFIRVLLLMEKGNRTGKYLPCNIEGAVGSGTHAPFNKGHGAVFYFDTRDTPGMDAASGIVIAGWFFWQDRAVRVTGD